MSKDTPHPAHTSHTHRDTPTAGAHPGRLAGADVAAQVPAARDAAELYRLYRPEWLIRHVAADTATATAYAEKHVTGRVHDHDIRIETHAAHLVHLLLRLPTLKGEFRTATLARQYADEQHWDNAVLVARNSAEDHQLRGYGRRRLRDRG